MRIPRQALKMKHFPVSAYRKKGRAPGGITRY